MCHPCNMATDDFELKLDVVRVAANTRLMGCYLRP